MKRAALLALVSTLWLPLNAAGAPAAPETVAQLEKVSGIVRVTRSGSENPAPGVSGASLYPNDKVTTLQGRAEVQFPGGNVLRLKSDTVLTVVPPAVPGKKSLAKTFAFLFKGSVNALVRSIRPEEGFAIRSDTAVASVKGTDFIFDGATVMVRDEHDAQQHLVTLSDAAELHSALVSEGMTAGVRGDGTISDPHPFDQGALDNEDRDFEGTSQNHAAVTGQAAAEAESAALHAELAEFAQSGDLARWSDFQERSTDLQIARVVKDRHGEWVRMDEHMLHPQPATAELLVLNERDGGPNKGVSYYDDRVTYNKPLPDDGFADIYRNDYAYLQNPDVYPDFYRVKETSEFASPRGDYIQWQFDYDAPAAVYDYWVKGNFTIGLYTDPTTWKWANTIDVQYSTQTGWGQRHDDRLFVGTAATGAILKEHYLYDEYDQLVGGWYAGVTHPSGEMVQDLMNATGESAYYTDETGTTVVAPTQLTVWGQTTQAASGPVTLYPYYAQLFNGQGLDSGAPKLRENAWRDVLGDYAWSDASFGTGFVDQWTDENGGSIYASNYADGTWLTQRLYLIDDEGNYLDPWAWTYNLEVEFEASEFQDPVTGESRTVDLVVDPEIFNSGRPSEGR